MRAERLGSYSMEATFAGTPSLFRRKSISRYWRLWPPPWWRVVMRPYAFRPAFFRRARVSDFSDPWRVMSEKSETLEPRRPAVVGLYFLTGTASGSLRFEDLDGIPRGQGDHGPLLVGALAGVQPGPLDLPLAGQGVHPEDPDVP